MARRDELWTSRVGGYIEPISPSGFDILIKGTSKYLNFNTTVGSTGYGLRDNAGTMEFKDYGGAWAGFGSGGGSGDMLASVYDPAGGAAQVAFLTDITGTNSNTNTGDEIDMTATVGGLVPTPPNNTTDFLRGDGTFAAPAGGGDMVLAGVQSVTGKKTFDTTKLAVKGSSTGVNTIASAIADGTDYTNTLPASAGTFALGTGTANEIAYWSATNVLGTLAVATYPSLTELAYVKGLTSAVQTQLNTAKIRPISIQVLDGASVLAVANGQAYFRIPTTLNGMNLTSCSAQVITTSSSGLPNVMITRGRQSSATSNFTYVDMLSTAITIDATEYDSKDATAAPVIDASNDDVNTGDVIRIDVDGAGTGTLGLNITLIFETP